MPSAGDAPCEKCGGKGWVSYNPSPVHAHIFAQAPCPSCRVIVSKAFVEAADALCDSIDAYWRGASSDRGGAAVAAYRTQRAEVKP